MKPRRSQRNFSSPRDAEIEPAMANHAALSIEKARLYRQAIEEGQKAESMLRETFDGIIVIDAGLVTKATSAGQDSSAPTHRTACESGDWPQPRSVDQRSPTPLLCSPSRTGHLFPAVTRSSLRKIATNLPKIPGKARRKPGSLTTLRIPPT